MKFQLIALAFLVLAISAVPSNAAKIRKVKPGPDLFTSIWSQLVSTIIKNLSGKHGENNNMFSAFENYSDPYIFNRTLTFPIYTNILSGGETNAYGATIRGVSKGDVSSFNYNRTSNQFDLKVNFPNLQFDGTYDMYYNDACIPVFGCAHTYGGDGEYYGIFENVTLEITTDFTFNHRVRAADTWMFISMDESKARVYAENYQKDGLHVSDWEQFSKDWVQTYVNNFDNNLWKGYLEETLDYGLNMLYVFKGTKTEEDLVSEMTYAGIPVVD